MDLWMKVLLDNQGQSTAIRLCPVASDTNAATGSGSAKVPWLWGNSVDPRYRHGSYGLNGWIYEIYPGADPAKFFKKESAVTIPVKTPIFFDGIWLDTWVESNTVLANGTDLAAGDFNNALGRLAVLRHPLKAGKVTTGQALPGGINMAIGDGHVERWKLQDIKNLVWHNGYTPIANPWSTTP
jgi:hypothetical protein